MEHIIDTKLISLFKLIFLKNLCILYNKSYINSIEELIYIINNLKITDFKIYDLDTKTIIGTINLSTSKPKQIISYSDYNYKPNNKSLDNIIKELDFILNINMLNYLDTANN
jgi:hypothetical protein